MIRFHVTQEDINNGHRCETGSCPVALAVKRRLPHLSYVSVGCYLLIVNIDTDASSKARYLLPKEVITFIDNYDNHKVCEPLSFELSESNRTA